MNLKSRYISARNRRRSTLSMLLVFALVAVAGCHRHRKTVSAPNTTDYADNLRTVTGSAKLPVLRWPNYSDYHAAVTSFYDDRNYEIAWLRDLKPTAQASAFIKAFQDAGAKGLNPEDYDASRWAARLSRIAQIAASHDTSSAAQDSIAQFDAAMTICVMRYISDLRVGRVNPQHFNFDINVTDKKYDLSDFVSDNAVDASDVPALIRSVEPDSEQYRATEAALAHYLSLAALQAAAGAPPLPDVPKSGIAPGGSYAATGELQARLQLEGDAPGAYPYQASSSAPPTSQPATATGKAKLGSKTFARARSLLHRKPKAAASTATPQSEAAQPSAPAFNPPSLPPAYTAELAAAVKLYQHRHGLLDDGKLTPDTIKSLNVPLTERVIQLQNSLERWRWLPNQYVNAPLMVNLPEFILRGYTPQHKVEFTMKVVVGKVVGAHNTPVFAHMMKYLIFRPYWNVPHDIVEKELMAHIRASGVGYLASHNFEVTDNKGTVLTNFTAEQIEHGGLQVREKPGPKNSLGLVKFMFPNQYDIYLHSTPQPELFDRTRRDFSHGCIRVQKPEDLAVWVLANSNTPAPAGKSWDADTIHDTMTNGQDNHQVNLKTPLPIVIFYLTGISAEDGHTHFFDDIYGYDQKLQQVLSKGPPYPVKPDPTMNQPKAGDTM
ncbi:MAG TPA: L,D-transpeptidase family protein [Acidobacteriaceae bacterium]|nr:L,D-transpeptidase family protein [Acidobacteriaceae bacterium]